MNLALLILQLVFFISLLGVIHTYLLYPTLMHMLGILNPGKKLGAEVIANTPTVDIIFAAYNEEGVIAAKAQEYFQYELPPKQDTCKGGLRCKY
jgi:hypothetical protein